MPKKPEPKEDNAVAIDIVQDILDYMEDNLLEALTPARIAKQFYLSTSALNIIFRVFCGMTVFEDMKVRCMFYGDCPGDDTDELLFRNAEPVDVDGQIIPVQTLEFYYENAEPDNEYYQVVENWLKTH